MSVHSGKFGVVNGHGTVQNWNVTNTSSPQTFVTSNTRGGTGRRKGNRDWSGSFQQMLATPTIMPGDMFTFLGFAAPENDVSGSGETFQGPAIIDQLQVSWDWSAGGLINSTLNFSGAGPLVNGVGSASDLTLPDVVSTIGMTITVGPDGIEWPNLLTAQLTITSANQQYVNSSTGGWNGRKPGPIDWSLAVSCQGESGDIPFNMSDDLELRLWVNEEEFWLLQWGHVREITGITVDRSSGAIIGRTVNIDMQGAGLSSLGLIRRPGAGTNWWPFAA